MGCMKSMVLAKPSRSPVASSNATSEFTRRSSGRSTPKKPRWLSCGARISSNSAGALVVASPGEKSASRLDDSIVCIDGPVCYWTFTGSPVSNCLLPDCPFAGQPAMSRHATIAARRDRCSCGSGCGVRNICIGYCGTLRVCSHLCIISASICAGRERL